MKTDDKWKLFKNFLHNELNISREDIREWIKEACVSEAQRLVDQEFGKFNLREMIKSLIMDHSLWGQNLHESICKETAKQLIDKIDMKLKDDKEND